MKSEDQERTPLGIYIHIPFCIRKCAYCDFLSGPGGEEEQEAYIQALEEEIRRAGGRNARGYQADTVFFGGGTPSILKGEQIRRLMKAVRESFRMESRAEVSLEANPGTVTAEKLDCWKEAGVSRISFGLQSADNRELALLGRIHTWEEFLDSWRLAGEAGFRNRNIDLMSALPGQTAKSWEKTLEAVTALQPEHISAYSLIIEEGTPFYERFGKENSRDRGLLPDEEEEREIYHLTKTFLNGRGYQRYEISNYARPGFACRHNQGYWQGKQYLGFGVGAASYIEETEAKRNMPGQKGEKTEQETEAESGRNPEAGRAKRMVRRTNLADRAEYIRRIRAGEDVTGETVSVTLENQMEEFCFLGLRMDAGISFSDFFRRFGRPFSQVYGTVTRQMKEQGLVQDTAEGICLTELGMDVSNYVFQYYLL